MEKNSPCSQCRVRRSDLLRIEGYVTEVTSRMRAGRVSQADIIHLALNALDEQDDIKLVDPSSVVTR